MRSSAILSAKKPGRLAIYGWHKLDGTPIQPLSIVHRDIYVDYSHGIRLIRLSTLLDGKPINIRHLMHSSELHTLVAM